MGVESISLGTGRQALSWLGVPMMVGDRVLGTMVALSFTHSRSYDEHDQDLLVAIANRVAVALENVHLLERAQARAEQEHLVRTITDRVRRGVDRQAIMRVALREMGEMLGASAGAVRLGAAASLQGQMAPAGAPTQGTGRPGDTARPSDAGCEDGPQDGDSHTDGTQEVSSP
jgi:GAF domain-containing protein